MAEAVRNSTKNLAEDTGHKESVPPGFPPLANPFPEDNFLDFVWR